MLFLFGLIVALAFKSQMLDAATAFRWAALATGVPLIFFFLKTSPCKEVLTLAIGSVTIAAATILWSPDKLTTGDEIIRLLILAGVFCLGASLSDLAPIWKGLTVGICLSGALAIAQYFGYNDINQVAPPAGLFMNKNMLAEAGGIAVICEVAFRWWGLLPLALVAWLLPRSYAAIGGVSLAAALYLYPARPKLGTAIVALLGIGVVCAFGFHMLSADVRMVIWENTLGRVTWQGYGLGSFAVHFPEIEFAHSELAQIIFELGVFSLPFFVIIYFALGEDSEPERSILIAILANGLFSFTLHLPVTAFAASLAAGHLVARRYRVLNLYADWAKPFVRFGEWQRPDIISDVRDDRLCGESLPDVFTSARMPNGHTRHDDLSERAV